MPVVYPKVPTSLMKKLSGCGPRYGFFMQTRPGSPRRWPAAATMGFLPMVGIRPLNSCIDSTNTLSSMIGSKATQRRSKCSREVSGAALLRNRVVACRHGLGQRRQEVQSIATEPIPQEGRGKRCAAQPVVMAQFGDFPGLHVPISRPEKCSASVINVLFFRKKKRKTKNHRDGVQARIAPLA